MICRSKCGPAGRWRNWDRRGEVALSAQGGLAPQRGDCLGGVWVCQFHRRCQLMQGGWSVAKATNPAQPPYEVLLLCPFCPIRFSSPRNRFRMLLRCRQYVITVIAAMVPVSAGLWVNSHI